MKRQQQDNVTYRSWETETRTSKNTSLSTKTHKASLRQVHEDIDYDAERDVPLTVALLTYFGYLWVIFLGVLQRIFFKNVVKEKNREDYVPLFHFCETLYTDYVYRRVKTCYEIPICSAPGATVVLQERVTDDNGWTIRLSDSKRTCVNLSSYNYLGFAENNGPCCDAAEKSILKYGVGTGNSRQELGTFDFHQELESLVARFLGVEDAVVCGMGFATNSLNIPFLLSRECLVLSDQKCHSSIVLGLRLSGAYVRIFKHNDMSDLEKHLKKGIREGQPATSKQWKKIVIFCEGIYSMEGSVVKLPQIIQLKKRYKAYLYLDEAHSIGAMGPNGKGILDYYGLNPKDVDVLMGTFTKSFGSAGGYIAGSRELINHLRIHSYASRYPASMSAPVAHQIITSMKMIAGEDDTNIGAKRLKRLRSNTRYFRQNLKQMGFFVTGHDDSPVIPMIGHMPGKVTEFVRRIFKRNVAVIPIGVPAVPMVSTRVRFCISAAHTQEMLDMALKEISNLGDETWLKYYASYSKKVNYEDIVEEAY